MKRIAQYASMLFIVFTIISCATLQLGSMESQLKDARILIALADHLVLTGKLEGKEWQPKIEQVRAAIIVAEAALKQGNSAVATQTWQDAVIMFIEIDTAIQKSKQGVK